MLLGGTPQPGMAAGLSEHEIEKDLNWTMNEQAMRLKDMWYLMI